MGDLTVGSMINTGMVGGLPEREAEECRPNYERQLESVDEELAEVREFRAACRKFATSKNYRHTLHEPFMALVGYLTVREDTLGKTHNILVQRIEEEVDKGG